MICASLTTAAIVAFLRTCQVGQGETLVLTFKSWCCCSSAVTLNINGVLDSQRKAAKRSDGLPTIMLGIHCCRLSQDLCADNASHTGFIGVDCTLGRPVQVGQYHKTSRGRALDSCSLQIDQNVPEFCSTK